MKLGRQGNLVFTEYLHKDRTPNGYLAWFLCPGCDGVHAFHLSPSAPGAPAWTFNGDYESPTMAPSLLCRSAVKRCHLFLRSGMLEFCNDCDHELAGQKVPLPEPPKWLE